jgi:hypothetical protein
MPSATSVACARQCTGAEGSIERLDDERHARPQPLTPGSRQVDRHLAGCLGPHVRCRQVQRRAIHRRRRGQGRRCRFRGSSGVIRQLGWRRWRQDVPVEVCRAPPIVVDVNQETERLGHAASRPILRGGRSGPKQEGQGKKRKLWTWLHLTPTAALTSMVARCAGAISIRSRITFRRLRAR